MELAGRTALLTGATGGLGRAIAAALADAGATVLASSRREEELGALVAELGGAPHRSIVSDLAAPGAGPSLAAEAGAVDVCVANAALPASGLLDAFSAAEIERTIRVNLEVPIVLARELLPGMRERGRGHVVLVSSLSGRAASPRASLYNATKFGMRGFALGLRQDLRGSGVGVSLVLPGIVGDAGMFADSGARSPRGFGTATAAAVGAAVVRAIDRNSAEVVVASLQQRFLSAIAYHFPRIAELSQRGLATRVAEDIARGQADKR
jgi:short-subunit dehydrogenase